MSSRRPTAQVSACLDTYCHLPRTKTGITQFGCCCCYVLVVALGLVLMGIAVPIYLNKTLDSELQKAGIIDSPNAPQYESWSGHGPDGPGYLTIKLYLFEYLNPLEMLDGEPAAIREVGPFVYRNYQQTVSVNWTDDRTLMYYRKWSYYVFQPSESVADPQHYNITTINMPFVAINGIFMRPGQNGGPPIMLLAYPNGISEIDKYFTTRSCHEIIWGYDDSALALLHISNPSIPNRYPGFFQNVTTPEEAQSKAKTDAIWTGVGDLKRIRSFYQFQDLVNLTSCTLPPCPADQNIVGFNPTWATREASLVRGHDGAAWAPGIRATDTLQMFVASFYRPVNLIYKQTRSYKGVSVFDYQIDPKEYEPASINPANGVYFQNGYNGLLNISAVLGQIPTYVTKPRFYGCDPGVVGPQKIFYLDTDIKDTIVSVEPRSGFTLAAKAGAQVNVAIGPVRGIPFPVPRRAPPIWNVTWFENLQPATVPIFWAEVDGGLDEAGADKWVEQVYGAMALIKLSRYVGAILGSLLLAMSIIGLSWVRYHRKANGEYSFDDDATAGSASNAPIIGGGGGDSNALSAASADLLQNDSQHEGSSPARAHASNRMDGVTADSASAEVPIVQRNVGEGTGLLSAPAATAATPQFSPLIGGGTLAGTPLDASFSPASNRGGGGSGIVDMPMSTPPVRAYQNDS